MAEYTDNVEKLYRSLEKEGFEDIGTPEKFREFVSDSANVSQLHKALSNAGYTDIGTEQEFSDWLGSVKKDEVQTPDVTSMQTASVEKAPVYKDFGFTAESPSPLQPAEHEPFKMPLMFKPEGQADNKQWAQAQMQAQYDMANPVGPDAASRTFQSMQQAGEAETARLQNRSQFDRNNFDKFYNEHVTPVFAQEQKQAEKRADEAVRNAQGSYMPGAGTGFAEGFRMSVAAARNLDPQIIANNTIGSVQNDSAFGDYIISRMGINGSAQSDKESPQLSGLEQDWMKRLFAKETEEVASQITQRIYDSYQQQNAPQSTLEYIAGKAFHENLASSLYDAMVRRAAGSSAVREQLRAMAYDKFGKDQSWGTRILGGAAPFAVDMLSGGFALPNLVGQAAVKGGTRMAAREMVKQMEKRAAARGLEGAALKEATSGAAGVAERYIATQAPIVNLALHTAGSAANFATYDVQAELVRQIASGEFKPIDLMKEAVHGAALGTAMGAAGGLISHASRNASTLGKVGADIAGIGAETGIFALSSGLQKAMDEGVSLLDVDWADTTGESLGMVLGMKGVGAVMHPGTFLNRYRKSKDYDLQLNQRDLNELKQAGFDLDDVFKGLGKFGEVAPMETTVINKAREYTVGPDGTGSRRESTSEEAWVDRENFDSILRNPNISSSTKRKLSYIATGEILSPEPMFSVTMDIADDGKASVTTMNASGEIIETKDYKNGDAARKDYDKLKTAARINTMEGLERVAEQAGHPEIVDAAKGRTNNETGIDIDNAEQLGGLTKEHVDEVMDSYIKNLQEEYMQRFNADLNRIGEAAERNANRTQISSSGTNDGGNGTGTPPSGTNDGGDGTSVERSGRRDVAYQRGASVANDEADLTSIGYDNRLATARVMQLMPDGSQTEAIRKSIMQAVESADIDKAEELFANAAPYLNDTQKEALDQYLDAATTLTGVNDAIVEQSSIYEQQQRSQLQQVADSQGNITPLTLKDGSTVYLKAGNLNNHYGSIMVTDGQGNNSQHLVREVTEMGETRSMDDVLAENVNIFAEDLQRRYFGYANGSVLRAGQQVGMILEGVPVNGTVAGTDQAGNVIIKFEDGSTDVFNLQDVQDAVTAADNAKIRQQIAGEAEAVRAAQREQAFTADIKGYAEGRPDLTAPETDAKTAADYLLSGIAGDDSLRKQSIADITNTRQQLRQRGDEAQREMTQLNQWLQGNEDIASPEEVHQTKGKIMQLQADIEDINQRVAKWGKISLNLMTPAERTAMEQQRRKEIFNARTGYTPQLPTGNRTTDNATGITLENGEPNFGLTSVGNANNYLLRNYPDSYQAEQFITEQRLKLRNKQRDEIQPAMNQLNDTLNSYATGEADLSPEEVKQLVHKVADLEAQQDVLSQQAVRLREIADGIQALYERNGRNEELSPAEQRAKELDKAGSKEDKLRIARVLYKDYPEAIDRINDQEPRDLEEFIAANLGQGSMNWEGYDRGDRHLIGVQEAVFGKRGATRGIGKGYTTNAFNHYLAPNGEGKDFNTIIHGLYEALPDVGDGKQWTTEDISDALINMLLTAQKPSDISHRIIDNRIAEAEDIVQREEEYEREMEEMAKLEEMQAWAEAYHLTAEEVETFEDYMKQVGEKFSSLTDEDIQNINAIFAESYINNQYEQNRESQGVDSQLDKGAVGGQGKGGEGQVLGTGEGQTGSHPAEQGAHPAAEAGSIVQPAAGDNVPGGTQKRVAQVKGLVENHLNKYRTLAPVEVISIDSDDDLKRIAGDEYKEARQSLKDSKLAAGYDPDSKKIYIFAENMDQELVEEALFHESLHRGLHQYYGDNYGDNSKELCDRFWETASSKNPELSELHKREIAEDYKDQPDHIKEEYFVGLMGSHMVRGSVNDVLERLDEDDKEIINNILTNIGYDTRKESAERKRAEENGLEGNGKARVQETGLGGGVENNSFEQAVDELGKIEDKWDELIRDYIFKHYPTQATVSAKSDSPEGLKEREAMKSDATLQEMRRNMKSACDAAQAKIDEAYKALPSEQQTFSRRLAKAIAETNTTPTEAQKQAGNYRKPELKFGGYTFRIENPKGSIRSGVDRNNRPWSQEMHDTYGYIEEKVGKDGDKMDFFINDDADLDTWNGRVFIIDQKNEDGTFDEHKVMYGYPSLGKAREAYKRNYEDGWYDKHVMAIMGVKKADFDKWLADSDHKLKPFSEYYRTKILKDTVKDDVDQLMADIAERKDKVLSQYTEQQLEKMDNTTLSQLIKKARKDAATSRVLLGTTNVQAGSDKEAILKRNVAQAEADIEALTAAQDKLREKMQRDIENAEAGGVMIDHLQDMGVDVTADTTINRRVRKQAEKDNSKEGKLRHMRTPDGTIYGFIYRGKMYLDPRKMDANRPLHEYGHLWCEAFRRLNPDGWKEVVSVMKQDVDTWKFIKSINPDLKSDDDIAEEMISAGSGERGQERIRQEFERMADRDPSYKGKWGNIWKNISKTIQDFWKKIGDFLHIKYETPEQVYDQVLRDFSNGVNPRKKVEQYLKQRDAEYKQAVSSGNVRRATEIFNEALKENVGNGMTPFVAVDKYRRMQSLAHKIKDGDADGIRKAAQLMSEIIPENAVLIPTPSHNGKATTMLQLAEAIAERTGSEVADILEGTPRESQYQAKKQTGKAIAAKDLGIKVNGQLPEGKVPVIIDNVVDTGNTAEACLQALGTGIVASLADSSEIGKRVATLRSAAPIIANKQGEVVPLSERFDLSRKETARPVADINTLMDDVDRRNEEARGEQQLQAAILSEKESAGYQMNNTKARQRATDAVLTALDDAKVPVKKVSREEADQMMSIFTQMNMQAITAMAQGMRPDIHKRYAVIDVRNPFGVPKYFEKKSYANEFKIWGNRSNRLYELIDLDSSNNAADIMPMVGWHGSGARFDAFDHRYMGSGEGVQSYGWGTYITEVEGIGKAYAEKMKDKTIPASYKGFTYTAIGALSENELKELGVTSETQKEALSNIIFSCNFGYGDPVRMIRVERERLQRIIERKQALIDDAKEQLKEDGHLSERVERLNKRIEKNENIIKETEDALDFVNSLNPDDFKGWSRPQNAYLYKVNIPEDTGDNYFDWTKNVPEERAEKILSEVRKRVLADEESGWNGSKASINRLDKQLEDMKNFFGATFYGRMSVLLGNSVAGAEKKGKRLASEVLSQAGYVGIKYPAQYMTGGRKDGATNYVIFNEADAKITSTIEFMFGGESQNETPVFYTMFQKGQQGRVYGWTDGTGIYLTPDGLNPNTPIHEYTHIWDKYIQMHDPDLWKEMVKVFKQTDMWQQIRENPNYRAIWDDDNRMASEVHSRLSGQSGEQKFTEAAKDETKDSRGIINKVKNVLKKFWESIAKLFGYGKKATDRLAEFVNMPLRDLLTKKFNPIEGGATSAIPMSGETIEKTLMGVHNISEEKLKKAIKLGGLANPSMAVIDTKNGIHTDYGEISLIPRSSLIDAKTGRNAGTYAGDAWTPTYPSVTKEMTSKGEKHKNQIAKEAACGNEELEQHLTRTMERYVDDNENRLHLLYLLQKGIKPDLIPESTIHTHDEYETLRKILGNDQLRYSSDGLTKEQNDAILEMMMKGVREKAEQQAKIITDEEKRQKAIDAVIKLRKDSLVDPETGNIWFAKYDTYIYDVLRDEKRRQNPKIDWYKTDNEASYRVAKEKLAEDYEAWKEQLFGDEDIAEKLFAGWTPDGNKKYVKNTVENASRLMNKEKDTNAYGNGGLSASKAMLVKKLKSLAEIRKYRHLIKKGDDIKEQLKQKESEWFDIIEQVSQMQKVDSNPFINNDIAEARLQEAMEQRDPIAYMNKEYGYHIDKDGELASQLMNFMEEASQIPVKYFETKFKRPVGIEEFAIAVVPTNTSPEVIKALEDKGLEVHTYEKGSHGDENDENRKAAVLNAIYGRNDILFHTDMAGESSVKSWRQTELFSDDDFLPEPKGKKSNRIKDMSDEELLKAIADKEGAERRTFIDIFDQRHIQEHEDAYNGYLDILNFSESSLDDAYQMYDNVWKEWKDGGYATSDRTRLLAQIDALEDFIQNKEEEQRELELERQEEEEAAQLQKEQEQFEKQKEEVRQTGYDLTQIRFRALEPGETCHVERRYTENKMFSFTGTDHIESIDDVAYIFRQLENKSVENTFVVLEKDGVPTVIHLAIGDFTSSQAPMMNVFAAYNELNPEHVWFVHNHPSGRLEASKMDKELMLSFRRVFGDKLQDGIIINTTSGKYGVFNELAQIGNRERPTSAKNETPLKVYSFDQQVFDKDWNPETAFDRISPTSIAKFISSHRLGEHKKMNLLVMDTAGHITGNIFLPWTNLKDAAKPANAMQIATYVIQMGGGRCVIYGNYDVKNESNENSAAVRLMNMLRNHRVTLMDMIHMGGNDAHYNSMHEKGVMEPESTSLFVGEPVTDYNEIARLEAGPKEIGYRNVVMNEDGSLGSPMANRLGKKGVARKATSMFEFDKWERSDEHPELATDGGKIDLIKPDGKTVDSVDYNPYIHIRPTLVNKQFKQAWERPNLVYVRTEYPKSELTSGYHADQAKLSVGRHPWNGGELILSRYDKPIEIVPWEEVADDWVKEFENADGIHFDIIPPKLLPILVERGMNILPPHKGMGKACKEAYEQFKSGGYDVLKRTRLDDANERFNNELDAFKNKQHKGLLHLGRPGLILRMVGIDSDEMNLSPTVLHNHLKKQGLDTNDLKGLAVAVQNPILVYKHGENHPNLVVVSEMDVKGGKLSVALEIGPDGHIIEISNIRSIHSKDAQKELDRLYPLGEELLKENLNWVDKEKVSEWLLRLPYVGEHTENKPKLDLLAKIVKDFENPTVSEENLRNIYAKEVRVAEETADLLGGEKIIFEAEANEEGALGWYDPKDGSIHVVLPAHADAEDVQRTVCHEKLGHEGLVALLGSQKEVDKFGHFVLRSADADLKKRIIAKADEIDPEWKDPLRYSHAAQEVIADIAADGPRTADDFTLWRKIKHYLIRFLNKLGLKIRGLLNDHDLSYYILKTGEALKKWNGMTDQQKREATQQGYDSMYSRGKGKPKKRNNESMAQYLQRLREWERWKIAEQQARDNNDPMPTIEEVNAKWEEKYREDLAVWKRRNNIGEDTPQLGEFPKRKPNETPQEYAMRVADYETQADIWKEAPSLFDYLNNANREYRDAYRAWKERYGIREAENVDLGLYEGDPESMPHIVDPEDLEADNRADAELAEAVGIDMSSEGAKRHTKLAVIERRKNLESANAEDAIWIYELTKRLDEEAKRQGVSPKELRKNMADIIEGTYFEDVLRDENGNVVSIIDISDQLPIKMTDGLKEILSDIKDWYDYFYHQLEDAGLRGEAGYIEEGYVNHVWSKSKSDPKAWEKYIENFQRTKSPNMRERIFQDYRSGEEVGLVRKFDDIAQIIAYYSSSNNQAIANRKFLDDLSFVVVEETNSDGEVTQILPLLNSQKPDAFTADRYDVYKVPGVGDVWVVKDIQRTFSNVFGTMRTKDVADWVSKFGRGYDIASSTAKKIQLSFSAFHMGALAEVAIAQMGPVNGLRALAQVLLFDMVIHRTLPAYARPDDFKFAASHLVQLGATQDYSAADVNNLTEKFRDIVRELANDENLAKKGAGMVITPIAVALDWINKGLDKMLWNYLHDGLKIACFKMFAEQIEQRVVKEGLTPEKREELLDEAGQYVNDTFGGQYWELLNISPSTVKWLRRAFLSPDWLISTQRHFLANFGFGSLYSESGFMNYLRYNGQNVKRLFGANIERNENRRFRSKAAKICYLIGVLGFFYPMMNALNAFFLAQDEEKEKAKADEIRKTNPDYKSGYELAYPDGMKWYDYTMYGNTLGQQTHLFLGRYNDGTEWYARWGKQFREFPELFMGRHGVEFPTPLMERMSGKANPVGRYLLYDLPLTVGMYGYRQPRETQEIADKYGNIVALLAMTAKKFIPYSVPTQEDKEFKLFDLVMPSQKGFTQWKAMDYFKTYIEAGDMDGIERTYNAAVRNGLDAERALKGAISSIKATQKKELSDGVDDLQTAMERFDAAKDIDERKLMKRKMLKYLAEQNYKAFMRDEAREQVESFLNGDQPTETDNTKYLELQTSTDVRNDYRISALKKKAKKYVDEIMEAEGEHREALIKGYRHWIQIQRIIRDSDNATNKLKKQLGKGKNDADIMNQIREIKSQTQKQIDTISPK